MTARLNQEKTENAYRAWRNGVPFAEFVRVLPPDQAAAVVLMKLCHQVHNGGFHQWLDNGYARGFGGDHLLAVLDDMTTLLPSPAVPERVRDLVAEALSVRETVEDPPDDSLVEADFDALDHTFRGEIGERAYIEAVEAYLWLLTVGPVALA